MASENVKDWDLPLSTPENISEQDDDFPPEQRRHKENLTRLANYIESMVYKPANPVKASSYTELLAKPKKRTLIDNAKQFSGVLAPSERGKRLERVAAKHSTITAEQLEKNLRSVKAKNFKQEDILKRKENIYYELLTKLELQSKTQYLNFILKKFAYFIAKLSTTMPIPPKLFEPHSRMQRGLFCNILHSLGVENPNQVALYYNNSYGSEYAVCNKLSHAILSILIKALDLASTRSLNVESSYLDNDDAMDSYIKNRLMQAAQKKILKCQKRKQIQAQS